MRASLPIALVLLILCGAGSARAEGCDWIFAGGQPPTLLNVKLTQQTTPLCNEAYAALASGVTRGPLWSAEHLTATSLARARQTPREGQFHEDERLPPDDRAMLSDYVRSGYDRGHMAPSGDMPDPVAQQQSFSLANIVPQAPELNRGQWEGVESAVRQLAAREGELYVVTGPAFQGAELKTLNARVLVPTATWKAVYDPARGGAGAYMCSNVSHPRCTTLSIVTLVQKIGLDPFPAVPAAVKQTAMPLPAPQLSRHPGTRRSTHRKQEPGTFDGLLR